jgi:DNA-binding XRE family transcriptional regulator
MEKLFRLPNVSIYYEYQWIDWDAKTGKFYLATSYREEATDWKEILKETAIALAIEVYVSGGMNPSAIKSCQMTGLLPGNSLKDTGDRLILARKRRGLTQKQLADLLELPEQSIQRYEKEGYQGATLKRLQEVEEILNP